MVKSIYLVNFEDVEVLNRFLLLIFPKKTWQPFFVLQKGSSRKPERKSSGTGRTRRRIDLSSASPKNSENIEDENGDENMNLRMEAFEFVWSKIESTIKVGKNPSLFIPYAFTVPF